MIPNPDLTDVYCILDIMYAMAKIFGMAPFTRTYRNKKYFYKTQRIRLQNTGIIIGT